jgi:hypothetical protein
MADGRRESTDRTTEGRLGLGLGESSAVIESSDELRIDWDIYSKSRPPPRSRRSPHATCHMPPPRAPYTHDHITTSAQVTTTNHGHTRRKSGEKALGTRKRARHSCSSPVVPPLLLSQRHYTGQTNVIYTLCTQDSESFVPSQTFRAASLSRPAPRLTSSQPPPKVAGLSSRASLGRHATCTAEALAWRCRPGPLCFSPARLLLSLSCAQSESPAWWCHPRPAASSPP